MSDLTPQITLYAHRGSQPCRAVELTLLLCSLPYEFEQLDFLNGNCRTIEYFTTLNPTGTVPTIKLSIKKPQDVNKTTSSTNVTDEASFVLHESHAIMKFICRLSRQSVGAQIEGNGSLHESLYPSLIFERVATQDNIESKIMNEFFWNPLKVSALIDQYMDWHHLGIRNHSLPIAHAFVILENSNLPSNLILEVIETRIVPFHTQLKKGLKIIEEYYLRDRQVEERSPSLLLTEPTDDERQQVSSTQSTGTVSDKIDAFDKIFLCTNKHYTLADLTAGCELYHLHCHGYPFLELGFERIVGWFNSLEECVPHFTTVHEDLIKSGKLFKEKYATYLKTMLE